MDPENVNLIFQIGEKTYLIQNDAREITLDILEFNFLKLLKRKYLFPNVFFPLFQPQILGAQITQVVTVFCY